MDFEQKNAKTSVGEKARQAEQCQREVAHPDQLVGPPAERLLRELSNSTEGLSYRQNQQKSKTQNIPHM